MNKILRKLLRTKPMLFLGKAVFRPALFIVEMRDNAIVPYLGSERLQILYRMRAIKKESGTLVHDDEMALIYEAVKAVSRIDGDVAQVGVGKGGTAKVICEAKRKKALHLFDTFAGLPKVEEIDKGFHEGQYKGELEEVQRYLSPYENVHFYKGMFPGTSNPVKEKKFSFVNFDVDLYKSTKDCIEFFYPRMNRGGVIICDDYTTAPGVKKAIDDFMADKPESVLPVSVSQCLIVKL